MLKFGPKKRSVEVYKKQGGVKETWTMSKLELLFRCYTLGVHSLASSGADISRTAETLATVVVTGPSVTGQLNCTRPADQEGSKYFLQLHFDV